jgi:dTDP-4-amino-4,6-dideoxygalactose transaminase
MAAIAKMARAHELKIVEDAAHALGTAWQTDDGALVPVGANVFGDLTIFSFHPVKTIAMGEGGAVSADDPETIARLRRARNHGLTRDAAAFSDRAAATARDGTQNPWYYELTEPDFNFRVPDINCALGLSQLAKLARFVAARQALVRFYDERLAHLSPLLKPLARAARSLTSWHIYPVRIDFASARLDRASLMRALAADGIGTQVHYIPVHRQPYYVARYGTAHLPGADSHYRETLTLPLSAAMTEGDAERVARALETHLRAA